MSVITTDAAPAAVGPYSQGRLAAGLVFVSGQLPIDPTTGIMADDPASQLRQSLANAAAILEAAGSSMAHVVKATVFVTDLAHFDAVNAEYAHHFEAPFPARSCVQVAALPKGAHVEVELIAVA